MRTILILLPLFICGCIGENILPPQNPKCDYKTNPLGIENTLPHFFWEVSNEPKGNCQSAYRILVASRADLLNENDADMWDSGIKKSRKNIHIKYDGRALESFQRYFWKVKIWNQNGQISTYSKVSWFETAFVAGSEWEAKWIFNGVNAPQNESDLYKDTSAPMFRKNFKVKKDIHSARLYISGLGYYEAYVNGVKAGNSFLSPGWTDYSKHIQYNTYDITHQLKSGENAIGVILGNGWYAPLPLPFFGVLNLRETLTIGQPKFIAQLKIKYSDGTDTLVISDGGWKTSGSPILRNNVYLGEKYDARLEQPGWNTPGFNDNSWDFVKMATPPEGRLVAQIQEPIKITKEVEPVSVTEVAPGIFIFDMGQNFAGCARLEASGPAGTKIQLRYGELLNEDGTLNDKSTIACHIYEGAGIKQVPGQPKNANQIDTYILKGVGKETYNSRFTFHGFRYVEVTGFPGKPKIDAITGLRMNSDLDDVGHFECSNELFNKIQENVEWTFLSNVFSVQSDCPGREKFGYGGDMVSASEAFIYNYAMQSFYKKTICDFQDGQKASGGMPECAPDIGINSEGFTENTGPIGWMIAHPFLINKLVKYYGDISLIEEQYASMKRLTDFIADHANGFIIDRGIGDHASVAQKDITITSTAFFYYCVNEMAKAATLLKKKDDQEFYDSLAMKIKNSFIKKFFDYSTGAIGKGTQADQVFALKFNLIPDGYRQKVLDFLIRDLENNNNHLSTGIFGTKFLFNILNDNDRNEVAYKINNQRSYPSYGYMIDKGATTLWEEWNGDYSQNHPMFGSVSEWFYKSLVGISPAPDAKGFDKIIIKPSFIDDLSWVNGSYNSIMGEILCKWNNNNGRINMEISIPGNTEALITLNDINAASLSEGGYDLHRCEGVEIQSENGEQIKLSAQPGRYSFQFNILRTHTE